jgi:hypothetical protein
MRLSSAQQWHVVTESGEVLGRLFDFRCSGAPKRGHARESATVETLVFGTVGLLERLGLRAARECEVRWRDVVDVRGTRVIVRTDAGHRARRR